MLSPAGQSGSPRFSLLRSWPAPHLPSRSGRVPRTRARGLPSGCPSASELTRGVYYQPEQELDFGIDATTFDIGVGYNTELSNVVDAYARLSFEYVDVDIPGFSGDEDDNGFGFEVGMRFEPAPQFELEGAIKYVDLDDSGNETAFALGGLYNFTPAFAAGLFAQWGDDVTSYTFLGRFYWGQ